MPAFPLVPSKRASPVTTPWTAIIHGQDVTFSDKSNLTSTLHSRKPVPNQPKNESTYQAFLCNNSFDGGKMI